MCDWKPDFDRLDERVDAIEKRLDRVEIATRDGLSAVNANIETLSQQITNFDKRLIEEKQKWGEVTRNLVKWTVRVMLGVVAYAAGINLTKSILPTLFN